MSERDERRAAAVGSRSGGEPVAAHSADGAFRVLSPAVLGYLRSQRVEDPEDLLGEVFVQVARSIDGFVGTSRELRRWVFTIARNRVVDDHRRRRRRPIVVAGEVPEVPAPNAHIGVDPDLVVALGLLTAEQREVVALRFIADLSLEEVAAITSRPVGAVKSMQHRALAALARALDDDGSAP